MNNMTLAIRFAGAIHLAIIAANVPLPGKLKVQKHLAGVPEFIRQIFYVHWIYIVLVLGFFSGLCLIFPEQLAGGSSLGRFVSSFIAGFWLLRIVFQLTYYDRGVRRENRLLDTLYLVALIVLSIIFSFAALGGGSYVLRG
jgi:hypothetical protein